MMCARPGQLYAPKEFAECISRDSAALLRWLQEQGYWFAAVSPEWDTVSGRLRYVLQLGEQVRIASVEVRVDSAALRAEVLRGAVAWAQGHVATRSRVEALLDSLLARAWAAGYPEARADVEQVRLVGTEAVLTLLLSLGAPARADTLIFRGCEHTRAEFLRRWVGIAATQVVSESVLREARQRLQELPWIELRDEPSRERLPDGRWAVVFTLQERSSNRVEGFLGYTPPVGGGGGWSGMVEAALQNLFGSGRSAFVRWYRAAAQLQELIVQYSEPLPPWLLVRARYELRQQDTVYSESGWELGLRWLGHLAAGWSAEGILGWRHGLPSGVVPQGDESRLWYVGAEFRLGRVQPLMNPIRGVALRLRPAYQWRRESAQHRRRAALEADAEGFLPLGTTFVLRLHGHTRMLWGDGLRWEEAYRIGGLQSLRGYREAQFITPRATWAGVEVRWLIGGEEHVGVFADGGYVAAVGWRTGIGVQWQLQTALGVLQLQVSRGQGDQLRQLKVGVRLLSMVW